MALTIEVEDLQNGYVELVQYVLKHGKIVKPRGIKTIEVMSANIHINNPAKAIPVGIGRRLNTAIGAAEALQFLGGVSDADQMMRISPTFKQFVVNGRFPGAYGPRVAAQFQRLVALFDKDKDSRQGEIVIWRPWDLKGNSPDVPCTVGLNFLVRNDKLHMFVNMRSNDVIWGLSYDGWVFANMQHALAAALELEVGPYVHFVGSFHIYIDRDKELIEGLHPVKGEVEIPPMFTASLNPNRNGNPLYRWARITEWARRSLRCPRRTGGDTVPPPNKSMKWYYDRLEKFPSTGLRCARCRYVLPRTMEFFRSLDQGVTRDVCRDCYIAGKRGTTREAVEALRVMQENSCGICGRHDSERKLVLDHCHETEKVRGWLCRACNAALGMIGENNLGNAISYLTKGIKL